MLQEHHLEFYKSSLNSNSNIEGKFLSVRELVFVVLGDLLFSVLDPPSTLRGCNFLIFNPFSTIVSVSDARRGGVQVLFGHQK